jgi:hypothetical protein
VATVDGETSSNNARSKAEYPAAVAATIANCRRSAQTGERDMPSENVASRMPTIVPATPMITAGLVIR